MRRFEIYLDKAWHDVTSLYVGHSYSLDKHGMNDRRSSMSSCRFSMKFHEKLYDAIIDSVDGIPIRVSKGMDVEFDGYMDPVLDLSYPEPDNVGTMVIEAVDFSCKLDEKIMQSASYPAVVDGPSFWIYNKDVPDMSILYRILEIAGLAGRISRTVPGINQKIRHIAWNANEKTYREIIDSLLGDYGYSLMVDGEYVTWIPIAKYELKHVDSIESGDFVGDISKTKRYQNFNGVSISWPKTKVMENALLWRGNLPIGDTSNPRPGEPIASNDYWPEDSDIIETWQDFGIDYLDVDYLQGKTRIKNDELTLISSSDWVLKDDKDEAVVLDPIDEDNTVVYEALRARLRYKNTGLDAKRLYYSQINGKALVKTHKISTVYPGASSNPDEYSSSYIYDKESAERLAKIRWMFLRKGCFYISFASERALSVGGFYYIDQRPVYDGYIQIESCTVSDNSPLIHYKAISTAPYADIKTVSTGNQGSGNASPGQDGSSPRFIYRREYNKPATPVGENPAGWTFDRVPDGVAPVWMSCAKFSSTGNLIGLWTEPVRMTGIDKGAYRGALDSYPNNPSDGDFFLYTGADSGNLLQYHLYKYVALDNQWVETIESDKVMAAQKDALQIAKDTGTLIYAALIFVELLVARKLMVGGGDLSKGLLCRFMDDDGNGKPVIEVRYNGEKLFWIDVDTGKMFGNFTEVVQYLPYTFNDSIDSSHPASFDFYIPKGKVDWIRVFVKGQPYRTYSSAAIMYGSSETEDQRYTVLNDNISMHYVLKEEDAQYGSPETGEASNHTHKYQIEGSTFPKYADTTASGKHTHSIPPVKYYTLTASGDYNHTHRVDISHDHNLKMGILEGTNPNNMTLSVLKKTGWSNAMSVASGDERIYDDIKDGDFWSCIRITSSSLGRVYAQVIIKMRIDTTL